MFPAIVSLAYQINYRRVSVCKGSKHCSVYCSVYCSVGYWYQMIAVSNECSIKRKTGLFQLEIAIDCA